MKKSVFVVIFIIFSLSLISAATKEKSLIISFSVNGYAADAIKEVGEQFKITVTLPYEINETALIAEFETEQGVSLFVKNKLQESGVTENDFTNKVLYTAKSSTGLIQDFLVNVRIKPEFKMLIGASFHPSYYPEYQMLNLGANGFLMIGGKFDRFIFGMEFSENYFTFNGVYQDLNLSGYWNILRGMFAYNIMLHKYFGIKWGVGGSWIYSVYEFNKQQVYARSDPGLALMASVVFYPWKFMEIELFDRIDLYGDVSSGTGISAVFPYNLGGARVTFRQFVKWLRIFVDVSALYSYYSNGQVSNTNVMLVINAGISLDLQFPKLAVELRKKLGKEEKPVVVKEEKYQKTSESLEEMSDAKVDEVITFWEIEFAQGSAELTGNSKDIISQIAGILRDKRNMKISLQTFSEIEDDPIASFTLSIDRAKTVKLFLLEQGISEDRIFIPGEALILSEKERTIMKYGIMKITILK